MRAQSIAPLQVLLSTVLHARGMSLQVVWSGRGAAGLFEGDEVGLDFNSSGDEVGDLDYQPALPHPLYRQQPALHAVEEAADHLYLLPLHVGSELSGLVVDGIAGCLHRPYKTAHLGIADNHRAVDGPPELVAILQIGVSRHIGVERRLRFVDEEKVLDYRHIPALLAAAHGHHHLHHGGEDLKTGGSQVVDGEILGVAPLEVAHHKPFFF